MSTIHEQVAAAIIDEQMRIMGRVARSIAERVNGLQVDDAGAVSISGSPEDVLTDLVKEFSTLTGPLGVRMCYTAAKPVLESSGLDLQVFSHLR